MSLAHRLAGAAWLAATAGVACAGGVTLPPPDGSTVALVGDSMVVNGRHVTLEHVRSARPGAEVLKHYREALDDDRRGRVVERTLDGHRVLARRVGDDFVTVRIRELASGETDIWVMRTPLNSRPAAPRLPPALVLPAGSTVLSNVESVDGGRRGHTVIAALQVSPQAAAEAISRSLRTHGYQHVVSDTPSASPAPGARRVMLYQRGAEDVMITITDTPQGRVIVMNATSPK